jgi:PAT family beta-lactamase induction signal transducer AmpG
LDTAYSVNAKHTNDKGKASSSLLTWVPSLYFSMGLPFAVTGSIAVVMYKNMGLSTEQVAIYTSQLYLPWALKPLWAPFLEAFKTKRFWVIMMQFVIMAAFGLIAFSLPQSHFFALSLFFFWVIGFASATQDIAIDGVFFTTTKPKQQARYAGLQGMCWNLGAMFASGVMVSTAGIIHDHFAIPWKFCWMAIMIILTLVMGTFAFWHNIALPSGDLSSLHGNSPPSAWHSFKASWITFFQKKYIWNMILVILMYRFGESFIEQIGPLFILEDRGHGGLGLNNQLQGVINGSAGTVSFVIGSFLGGHLVSRLTLQRSFIVLALSLNLPHLTYYYLSHTLPTNLILISAMIVIEKFGFGVGSVGLMLYMVQQVSPGPFRMTHYAYATALMGMTRWLAGWASGPVFSYLNHSFADYFSFVLLASIPPILIASLAPFPIKEPSNKSGA